MKEFDAVRVKEECINWIRDWFEKNGKGCNAIVGISGGKDSSVVAALLCEALGIDRVIGVMMPNGVQPDIDDSKEVCAALGIKNYTINIHDMTSALLDVQFKEAGIEVTKQTKVNLSPRIRMSVLYAVSQSNNGRVANTCNLSEDWVGYSTRYGDAAGDFSPLAGLTVTEVRAIGALTAVPKHLVVKAPSDGLTGLTDEDNLGFTYDALDKYIRTGLIDDEETKEKIDHKHELNLFKMKAIPGFHWNDKDDLTK